MNFYIDERCEHLDDSANAIYNLSNEQFHNIIFKYINTKEIPNIKQNTREIIEKRGTIINSIKQKNKNLDLKNEYRNIITELHEKHNNKQPYCAICGDTNDMTKLIEIINHDHNNKNICIECMEYQKNSGTKFSVVKNNKSKIL